MQKLMGIIKKRQNGTGNGNELAEIVQSLKSSGADN